MTQKKILYKTCISDYALEMVTVVFWSLFVQCVLSFVTFILLLYYSCCSSSEIQPVILWNVSTFFNKHFTYIYSLYKLYNKLKSILDIVNLNPKWSAFFNKSPLLKALCYTNFIIKLSQYKQTAFVKINLCYINFVINLSQY